MSLIKANAVQIGQSPTATQNFTLAVPSSPDGTIKLARGNSGATTQDVINVSNAGVVSFPQGLGNISNSTAIATGSTTARSLANRFADVVNVKDFGAVGDGVADDTAAIQAAINESVGKTLVLQLGTYLINGSGLIIPSNITIKGYGATVKVSTTPTANLFEALSKQNIVLEGIVIDANNYVVASNIGMFAAQLCSNVNIFNCRFINMDRFAVIFNGGSNVTIENNYISKTTASINQNEAILVSSSAGEASNFKISGNRLVKSGMDVSMVRSEISKNVISDWKFGAGITTEQDPLCNTLVIAQNICYGGAAIDVNAFRCGGIENWAAYSVIEGNICFSNFGAGIDQGGLRSTIIGNVVYNNGLSGGGSGISARYGTASYNATGCVFSGNRCFDTSGAGGTQDYGYEEQSALLADIVVSGNSFQQNKTGQIRILSSSTSYSGNSTTYTTTFNPPSLVANELYFSAYTVAGSRIGDLVNVSFSLNTLGVLFYGYVTVDNTVEVAVKNLNPTTTVDLGSGTLTIRCEKTSVNQNSY